CLPSCFWCLPGSLCCLSGSHRISALASRSTFTTETSISTTGPIVVSLDHSTPVIVNIHSGLPTPLENLTLILTRTGGHRNGLNGSVDHHSGLAVIFLVFAGIFIGIQDVIEGSLGCGGFFILGGAVILTGIGSLRAGLKVSVDHLVS